MKSLNNYINEVLVKQNIKSDKDKENFMDLLGHFLFDFENSFIPTWNLEFLYDIFYTISGNTNPKIKFNGYDMKTGKRFDPDKGIMFSIEKSNSTFAAIDDGNGQIKWEENDKYIDVFGYSSEYREELGFGISLIDQVLTHRKCQDFKLDPIKYTDNELINDIGCDKKIISELENSLKKYKLNNSEVITGTLSKKGETPGLRNNIWVSIIKSKNKKNTPVFKCHGAGLHGSKNNYEGPDEDKFKETINLIIKNHLYIK